MQIQLNGHEPGGEVATTVLVVEDDASLRLLCRLNLELERYHVLEAGTLDVADELLTQEPVDVVLLDLHVAGRHGTELLPVIKEECPRASVCLLSGTCETDPPLESRCRRVRPQAVRDRAPELDGPAAEHPRARPLTIFVEIFERRVYVPVK